MSNLDTFLGMAEAPNTSAATKVLKVNYDALVANRNLTTYSTASLFHTCPRKFMIKKLQAATGTSERITSPTFAFGHAVGAGIATYDQTQSIDKATFEAFMAWDIDLFEEEQKKSGAGKSFIEAIWALYSYEVFYNESQLSDYEVVNIEATLAIDFEDGHFYSGHIDELLRHKVTGKYLVKENKTTGLRVVDPVLYSNSDQALSYAVVIDMLGASEYSVLYTIYSSSKQEWITYEFVKQPHKKIEWLQDQLVIHETIDRYTELKFFPKRGASCFNFMRRCEYADTCDLSAKGVFNTEFSELPALASLEDLEAIEHIDYKCKLSDILTLRKTEIMKGEL